jgi:transposase
MNRKLAAPELTPAGHLGKPSDLTEFENFGVGTDRFGRISWVCGVYPTPLLAAIDIVLSCRTAAARFDMPPSTAIRWHARRRDTGTFAAKPQGGDLRSGRIEERAGDILTIWDARKDISLEELRVALAEIGHIVSMAGLHRFFVRRDMTRKKKDWPCNRAGPPCRAEPAAGLVRGLALLCQRENFGIPLAEAA